jgi:hypothetical protein
MATTAHEDQGEDKSDVTPTMTPMMLPVELLLVPTAKAPVNSGGGGGATLAIAGGVTTASTVIETPVTLANMAVALLGLLVAVAIVDCTEAAVARGVRMLTPTMTLPAVTVNSTADEPTPARAAIALFIWSSTLEVNEETSPASRRLNPTTLIVGGGDGGGGEGEGGGGEGDGGGGDGDGGSGEGGGGEGDGGEGEGGEGGGEGEGGGGEGGGGDEGDGGSRGGGGEGEGGGAGGGFGGRGGNPLTTSSWVAVR